MIFTVLEDAGLTGHELSEVLHDPHSVVVIEWGNIIEDYLDADHITLTLTPTADDRRQTEIKYPKQLQYLVADLW